MRLCPIYGACGRIADIVGEAACSAIGHPPTAAEQDITTATVSDLAAT